MSGACVCVGKGQSLSPAGTAIIQSCTAMGELGANHLRVFDPVSAELYASVSSDNRLRIWNTVRGPTLPLFIAGSAVLDHE